VTSSAEKPAGQLSQSSWVTAAYLPSGQSAQSDNSSCFERVPSLVKNVPVGQNTQKGLPISVWILPAEQIVQVSVAGSSE
jgi:hypothetical protein